MKSTGTTIFGKASEAQSRNPSEGIPLPVHHQKPQRHLQDKNIPLVKPSMEGKTVSTLSQISQRGASREMQTQQLESAIHLKHQLYFSNQPNQHHQPASSHRETTNLESSDHRENSLQKLEMYQDYLDVDLEQQPQAKKFEHIDEHDEDEMAETNVDFQKRKPNSVTGFQLLKKEAMMKNT